MKKLLIILLITGAAACKKDKKVAPDGNNTNTPTDTVAVDNCTQPELMLTINSAYNRPCAIAVSPSGMVAVTQYIGGYGQHGDVKVWKSYSDLAEGLPVFYSWMNTSPEAVAFDDQDNIFISETEQVAGIAIYLKNENGYAYHNTIQGGFNNPRGLAVHNGALYLADDGNNRVVKFSSPLTSTASATVISGLQGPKGLAIINDALFVTQYGANNVTKYTIDNWDTPAAQVTVNKPVDIAVKDGLLVVCSPENGKLHLFSANKPANDCTKEISLNTTLYGISFTTGSVKSLLIANHNENKVQFYNIK